MTNLKGRKATSDNPDELRALIRELIDGDPVMSLDWMETECGDLAACCEDTTHPVEPHHHIHISFPFGELHKDHYKAIECTGDSECAWKRGLGTLYVTHTPAGYWDDEPGEWWREDLRGGEQE